MSIPKRNTNKFSSGSRFDLLLVEGQDDSESVVSSPEKENGGVLLTAGQQTLNSDLHDDCTKDIDIVGVSPQQKGSFVARPTEFFSETTIPEEVSRYYSARQLNKSKPRSEDPNEPSRWIPHINGPWWRLYSNRLRVYGTETGVCNIDARIK